MADNGKIEVTRNGNEILIGVDELREGDVVKINFSLPDGRCHIGRARYDGTYNSRGAERIDRGMHFQVKSQRGGVQVFVVEREYLEEYLEPRSTAGRGWLATRLGVSRNLRVRSYDIHDIGGATINSELKAVGLI